MVRREVVDAIGLPDPAYFIFYDDVDFAIRARRAGFRIWAVRDAVLVRQLDFDQQHAWTRGRASTCTATSSSCTSATARTRWSGSSRTLITLAVVLLSPLRGGRAEARNVIRAIRGARGMRGRPTVAESGRTDPLARLDGAARPVRRQESPRVRQPDLVVVGSGFFGLTIAERCASELGPEGPGPRAPPPPRRQRLQREGARDRHRGAQVRRPPLPHLQREGVGVRQPVHRPSPATSTGSSASTRGRSTRCR